MAKYLDNNLLLSEIIKSKELNELTPDAVKMIQRMVKECVRPLRYKYIEDKDDCMAEAMFDVVKYWRNFNPNHPKANVFSFFTQMIKNGLAKGLKKVKPQKDYVNVSLSQDQGIYNL